MPFSGPINFLAHLLHGIITAILSYLFSFFYHLFWSLASDPGTLYLIFLCFLQHTGAWVGLAFISQTVAKRRRDL